MTDYAKDVAAEYGLDIREVHEASTCFGLGTSTIIGVIAVALDVFQWRVFPFGSSCHRHASGYANTFDEALRDAEGMLRHYLVSHTRDEVLKVWSEETLKRINLGGWK